MSRGLAELFFYWAVTLSPTIVHTELLYIGQQGSNNAMKSNRDILARAETLSRDIIRLCVIEQQQQYHLVQPSFF